jgi:hypothetical protein
MNTQVRSFAALRMINQLGEHPERSEGPLVVLVLAATMGFIPRAEELKSLHRKPGGATMTPYSLMLGRRTIFPDKTVS